jgi:hypothetical protein
LNHRRTRFSIKRSVAISEARDERRLVSCVLPALVAASLATCASLAWAADDAGAVGQLPLPKKIGQVFVLNDFNDDVTRAQLATNDFAGNSGLIAPEPGIGAVDWSRASQGPPGGSLRLRWNFAARRGGAPFVGVFQSLFGLTDTKVSLDGGGREPAASTPFPGFWLDATNVFGTTSPRLWAYRSLEELRFDVKLVSPGTATLRVELKDEGGTVAFTRVGLRSGRWQRLAFELRPSAWRSLEGSPDWTRLSLLSFVVEWYHEADGISNPTTGELLFDNLVLVDRDGQYEDLDKVRGKPQYARAFLEHVRATSFLYFLDFAARADGCGGMIQDRASFADLLSVGGAGFQLTAYTIGAQRQYLSREEAARRVLALLRLLHDGPQGPDRVGRIGYQGFFYHFLGSDGRRKQNFDFAATAHVDESLNTVELSVIDTALALCGVITARQYFDGRASDELRIRALADAIYARVNWPFMLDAGSNQFYLGWKPTERRDDASGRWGRFALDDHPDQRLARGQYSSKRVGAHELPATLDYYTDEGLLVALLAAASPNASHRVDSSVFFSMARDGSRFVKTFPGSLFTYQFASCWLDTRALGPDRDPSGKARPIDYFQNTQMAIDACLHYAARNPYRRSGMSRLDFGLSACDGPFGGYFAEAAPPLALAESGGIITPDGRHSTRPLEVGTLTVYGAACSILHHPRATVDALWNCQRLGLLHPRFGFADAYQRDVADALSPVVDPRSPAILRTCGPWVNRTGFAIDHGPMLILIDSFLESRFVPQQFMSYPAIADELGQLFPQWQR